LTKAKTSDIVNKNRCNSHILEVIQMSIATIRKSRGMTQEYVAEKVGVDQTSVSQWEKGKTKPRVDTLIKLAELFECSVDELVKQ